MLTALCRQPATLPKQLLLDELGNSTPSSTSARNPLAPATLHTLLKEIRRTAAMIKGGCSPKGCHDFAMRRLTWRVQYDLKDGSTLDEALWLVRDATGLRAAG